jgi:hypothetical protein
MKLPEWHNHFLGLTGQDLGMDDPFIQGVVHGPGLVCQKCQTDLSFGIIVSTEYGPVLWGQDCADECEPGPWVNLLRIAQYYLTLRQLRADQALKPGQRKLLRGLALTLQLNPANKFARGMRNVLLDGKVLSEGQADAVKKIIDEMGGIQIMLIARDQLRRLSILGSLKELSPKDAETVSSLLNHLPRQEYLSDKQNRLIYALQDKYSDEVLEYTCQLISAWPPIGGWLWKLE